MDLTQQHCVPCEGGTPPIKGEAITPYLKSLKREWELVDGMKLKRAFQFDDFTQSMAFVNSVAALAEAEQHHPDIHIFYSRVTIELWTHAIGGLSENDFIMASKIEQIAI